ncbi:MAG: methylenetetrahydrofolate reductase [NAD(P)H] [Lachnospiraceae bacterium]|nr:methylenetetrahydrofolate reductase [NAD(P)H] [Lachnospiraceae bacterium]
MAIESLFAEKTVFSFEIFPPKREAPISTVYQMLREMKGISPDFISVTYGAGGSVQSRATLEICEFIRADLGIESVAHMPALYLTKSGVERLLEILKDKGIRNILALRGDRAEGEEPAGDFTHASDLAAFIRRRGDFHIIGAAYPEGHQESENIVEDTLNLRKKVDAGVSHLITQLFFDNDYFYRLRERLDLAGIHVPVEAGIMPVTNEKQIKRMATLCGATLPKKFLDMMDRYAGNPLAIRDAGLAYAIDQIVDLAAHDVDGIHLYTMNNPYIAKTIYNAVVNLL